jgi:hypothetical protein
LALTGASAKSDGHDSLGLKLRVAARLVANETRQVSLDDAPSEDEAQRMTRGIDEDSEARFSRGRYAASTKDNYLTLGLVDVVHTDVEMQLLWVLWVWPPGRYPSRHSLEGELSVVRADADDDPVAEILVHLHPEDRGVERSMGLGVRAVDHRLF